MTTLAEATIAPRQPAHALGISSPAGLEVVIPVHNEERVLRESVSRLHRRLVVACEVPFRVTIAYNASSDRTAEIARSLAHELGSVQYLRIEEKGRGRALRAAWSTSDADVLAYMDVDLSTDLAHLPALFEPLLAGRADLVVGSRLAPGAEVTRGLKRELISRGYNALLGIVLGAGFSDAQCGFKAVRREVIRVLLPLIEDEGWFFDTELLYLAQRNGFSIRELPVRWVDDSDSRVDIARTVIDDLKGIARLRNRSYDGRGRSGDTEGIGPTHDTTKPRLAAKAQPHRQRGGDTRATSSNGHGPKRAGAQQTAHGLP
jgi:glycosyltransferase involved in cell wall biosynthesis